MTNKLLLLTSILCLGTTGRLIAQQLTTIQLVNSGADLEYSGLCAYQDKVYLLPQYGASSHIAPAKDYKIFSLDKTVLLGYLSDMQKPKGQRKTALVVKPVPLKNIEKLPGYVKDHFRGFEAIVIYRDTVFMTIETAYAQRDKSVGFVIRGMLNKKTHEIDIDPSAILTVKNVVVADPVLKNVPNEQVKQIGFEAITLRQDRSGTKLFILPEFNTGFGMRPFASQVRPDFGGLEQVPIAPVDFRITDMTQDDTGKWYALNYYYPGERALYVGSHLDEIRSRIPGFAPDSVFARIVQLEQKGSSWVWKEIKRIPTRGNNWEGLVRLANGFLIISDANKNPEKLKTTLAYIAD
ncbi:hypothetical protein [Paraflavitalea pollutisoli]|uniref:hypothetical protein n=1 Tax=Paraflavitalea pollutisoli TaxID=3034143 RepID=UPI0023EC3ED5|nr:hypothetical protein [Paraflavitalea sp. H1-2-19X]